MSLSDNDDEAAAEGEEGKKCKIIWLEATSTFV
jgi:hypothetical protein